MGSGGSDRPNVLFIICDDLNNAIAGMGRQPCAPAPNLQRLMAQGVRFPNAYSNCPVCLPARNALFSGLYAHTTGHFTLWDHWRSATPLATTGCYGRRDHGVPLLRDAVMLPKHFKDHGYTVLDLGKAYYRNRQYDQALNEFIRAQDLLQDYTWSYIWLGRAYKRLELFDEAEQTYYKAHELDPAFIQSYISLGDLASNRGQPDTALAFFRQALEIDPFHESTRRKVDRIEAAR